MNTIIITILAAIVIHFSFCGVAISDLFNKSERPNKPAWLALIIMLPVLGVILYNMTKQRQRVF